MSFYSGLAKTARDVLARYGQTGTVTRRTVTGGGPADPSGGSVAEQTYSLKMAVFPISRDRINETSIKAGDFQVICEASDDIELTADDLLTVAQGSLRIVTLGKIAPAGTVVVYDMIARGA